MKVEQKLIGIPFERLDNIPPEIANDYFIDVLTNGNTAEREFEMITNTLQYLLYGDYEKSGTEAETEFPTREEMYVDVIVMKGIFDKTIETYKHISDVVNSTGEELSQKNKYKFIRLCQVRCVQISNDLDYTAETLRVLAGLMSQWEEFYVELFIGN